MSLKQNTDNCLYCDIPIEFKDTLRFTNMSLGVYQCPKCKRDYAK